MGLCAPWDNYFIHNQKQISKHIQQQNMTSCWKALDHSLNICEGLIQWYFVPLGPTLTYKNSSLNNLINWHELNQYINCGRCNHKNRHSRHDLPQACRGNKSVCQVWIKPTGNFQSYPRTSFRINERWYNKYDAQKSTINKIRLEQINWRWFQINHTKTPKNTLWINNWINKNYLYRFDCISINQE